MVARLHQAILFCFDFKYSLTSRSWQSQQPLGAPGKQQRLPSADPQSTLDARRALALGLVEGASGSKEGGQGSEGDRRGSFSSTVSTSIGSAAGSSTEEEGVWRAWRANGNTRSGNGYQAQARAWGASGRLVWTWTSRVAGIVLGGCTPVRHRELY